MHVQQCTALIGLHTTPGGEGLRQTELHTAARADEKCPSSFSRELRRLSARAYPQGELPDAALVQLFIKGLKNTQIERHVSLQAPGIFDEAVKHACAFMAYPPDVSDHRKPKPTIQSVAKVHTENAVEKPLVELSAKYDKLLLLLEEKPQKKRQIECKTCHGRFTLQETLQTIREADHNQTISSVDQQG